MLSRLRNMFRVPDLRNKILFTILIIAIYRVGAHLPVPYVNFSAIKDLQDQANNSGVVGFLDLFSGGAITNVAIFFLGIMPYITASIIMQLLQVVIPKLEQWQQEGQVGQKKITQWTRYVTIGLALIQSTGFVFALHQGKGGLLGFAGFQGTDMIPDFNAGRAALIVLTWTAGTAVVMWLGELITQRGIGNGMSILIFASVVSRLPAQGSAIYTEGSKAQFFTIIAHRHRHDRRHRLRRIGAAPHPCAIRQTCRRPPHVRRPEHLHPAEGQPVGCDPGDLRELDPRVPRVDRVGARQQRDRAAGVDQRQPGEQPAAGGTSASTRC